MGEDRQVFIENTYETYDSRQTRTYWEYLWNIREQRDKKLWELLMKLTLADRQEVVGITYASYASRQTRIYGMYWQKL